MRTLLLLLLAASAVGGGPVVRESGSAHDLVLPAAMRRALEGYDSSFKVWAEKDYAPLLLQEFEFTSAAAPFAVIGDFNGDTSPDAALHGVTKASEVVVVVLSGTRGSYTARIQEVSAMRAREVGGDLGH